MEMLRSLDTLQRLTVGLERLRGLVTRLALFAPAASDVDDDDVQDEDSLSDDDDGMQS